MIKDTTIIVACTISLLSCGGDGSFHTDNSTVEGSPSGTTTPGGSPSSTAPVAPTGGPSASSPNAAPSTSGSGVPAPTPGPTGSPSEVPADNTAPNDATDPVSPATDPDGSDPSSTSDGDETGSATDTMPAPSVNPSTDESTNTDVPSEPDAGAGPEPDPTTDPPDEDVVDTGADEKFSFFVTSYHHIQELSGTPDGFGGDLRYNGAATGLDGADAICQEIGRRVGFGQKTWRAYLSTSTVNAIDRIGNGPWYDHAGQLVANDPSGLTSGDRPAGGCCDSGTYDELGIYHDGKTDVNNDGMDDDDHDTMTATLANGTYAGFSCDDWTSTTAMPSEGGGGRGGGIQMGHSWPARSGQGWSEAHAGHACAAGTNFIQNGGGDSATVGGGGGYGGIYCFALSDEGNP